MTRDSDFYFRAAVMGQPPKIIWLRLGNCSTDVIEQTLRDYHAAILRFEQGSEQSVLTLPYPLTD